MNEEDGDIILWRAVVSKLISFSNFIVTSSFVTEYPTLVALYRNKLSLVNI